MVDEASGAKPKQPARKQRKKARRSRSTKKANKPGRPEFVAKKEERDKVEVLIGGGMTIEEIAAAVDVDVKTLKKHFAPELRKGRSKKRAAVLEAMFKAAIGGNVSAQKAYAQLNALADADDAAQGQGKDEPAQAPSKAARVYKGKKEIAQEEAMTAGVGSDWGTDLDPTAPPAGTKAN